MISIALTFVNIAKFYFGIQNHTKPYETVLNRGQYKIRYKLLILWGIWGDLMVQLRGFEPPS